MSAGLNFPIICKTCIRIYYKNDQMLKKVIFNKTNISKLPYIDFL